MPRIVVFTDKVGITAGYNSAWQKLLFDSGLLVHQTIIRSAYQKFPTNQLLTWSKTRKQPGFHDNPAYRIRLRAWAMELVESLNASAVICMDQSMLFMMNPAWNQATLDTLRGGVYWLGEGHKVPWLVTLPITAVNTHAKAKDIAALNGGYTDKSEWEESIRTHISTGEDTEADDEADEDESEDQLHWQDPITVPYGKYVLTTDLLKLSRILRTLE